MKKVKKVKIIHKDISLINSVDIKNFLAECDKKNNIR